MLCPGCGFTIPHNNAPADRNCMSCAKPLRYHIDDFLLHGMNGLVREVRAGQVEMGRIVWRAMEESAVAVVEASVGTGKTFAYTGPALLREGRWVIATAKKGLQHQIYGKDLPYLSQTMMRPTEYAIIKGKSNYACRVKAKDIPLEQQKAFFQWLDTSATGDITDYPGKRPFFWNDITAEDCLGPMCKHRDTCGYFKSRQQMKGARIIVANHHVVAFDLRYGPFKLLGPYDGLIIDEAHQAPAAFRGAFAKTVTPSTAKRLIRKMDKVGFLSPNLDKVLENGWDAMFKRIEHLDGEIPANPFGDAGDDVIETLQIINRETSDELKNLGVIEVDEDGEEVASGSGAHGKWQEIAEAKMLKGAVERVLEAVKTAREPDDNTVVYITSHEAAPGQQRNKSVTVSPISVGKLLGPKIASVPTVIVTSATIAVNGKFDDIIDQLGLDYKPPPAPAPLPSGPVPMAAAAASIAPPPRKILTGIFESPFDYNRQAVLYTPRHIPQPVAGADSPERDKYLRILSTEVFKLLRASDGNAFVLFTSTSDMKEVYARLQEEDLDNPLIMQTDDAEAAFKQFMRTPRSVILGLKSFWEGVDVQGDKLRLVIITKLPFPMVSDPIILARTRQIKAAAMERGQSENAANSQVFNALQIPAMITDLRQGAGRLIRSKTDKGVLAILDPRVWTGSGKSLPTATQTDYKGYGKMVVDAIGFGQRTSSFEIIDKVLQQLRKEEAQRVAAASKGRP